MSKSTTPKAAPRPRSPETHLDFNTRNNAAEILQSYEQLAWYALARNEVSKVIVVINKEKKKKEREREIKIERSSDKLNLQVHNLPTQSILN
jgi:predicted alpha-1,6-mannanase (GH76 family)